MICISYNVLMIYYVYIIVIHDGIYVRNIVNITLRYDSHKEKKLKFQNRVLMC